MKKLFKSEMRQLVLVATAFVVVAFTMMLTDRLGSDVRTTYVAMRETSESNTRSIASVQDFQRAPHAVSVMEEVIEEHQLAREMSSHSGRGIASVPNSLSDLDQLRFGELGGRYQLLMNGDRVQEIRFVAPEGEMSQPIKLPNGVVDFVQRHAQLLGVVGAEWQWIESNRRAELVNPAGGFVAQVRVDLDEAGHLLRLNIAPTKGDTSETQSN